MSGTERAPRWTIVAVVASALYAFLALTSRAWGLTFVGDDWLHLEHLAGGTRPAVWLAPINQHWNPIFLAAFDAIRLLGSHDAFVIVAFVLHVVNLALLARLLSRRVRDERTAALVVLAFGLAPAWRILLWWATGLCVLLAFTITAVGFIAADEARRSGSRRALAVALLAVFTAPLAWGGGLALGPALALEALVLERPRLRRAAPYAIAWLAHLVLYAIVARDPARQALPATWGQVGAAVTFFGEAIGLGFVQQVPLLPVWGDIAGVLLAFAWAAIVAVIYTFANPENRRAHLLAQGYLALLIAPMAVTRWWHVRGPVLNAGFSHYQYLPAFAWTTALAVALDPLVRRRPRVTTALALLAIAWLAHRHAEFAVASNTVFAPHVRRHYRERELAERIVAVASSSREPLYDAPLPAWFAPGQSRASGIVAGIAPLVSARWTDVRSEESLRAWREDVLTAELLRLAR